MPCRHAKSPFTYFYTKAKHVLWKAWARACLLFTVFFSFTTQSVNYNWEIVLIQFVWNCSSTKKWTSGGLLRGAASFLLRKQATSWALILFQATEKKLERKTRKPDLLNHRLPENDTDFPRLISWYVDCNTLHVWTNNSAASPNPA